MIFANRIFPFISGVFATITVLLLFIKYENRRRFKIVAVFLLFAWSSWSPSVGAAVDFVACDTPNDGVVDIVLLYDSRMFNVKALRYAPNYDPIPEFAF
uniref:Uncharacterized protein n=1 Tax=Romanomermis culicivorax TaxID=13658 RepID=A0A915L5E5_ROMCU